MPNFSKTKLIAIIGVSENPEKYGHKIFRDLLAAGFAVIGVNPRGGEVAGQKLLVSLAAVQPVPELVMLVVPPAVSEQVVAECAELGVKEVWFQPGSESVAAIAAAKKAGLAVTSGACFMVRQGVW